MPASTNRTELVSTGNSTKARDCSCISTISKATAPPGGCRQRMSIMRAIARPTASAAASIGPGSQWAHSSPTSALSVLPATTGQGCANGLAGAVKTSTALAPTGAMSQTAESLLTQRLRAAVSSTPSMAPKTARRRSVAAGRRGRITGRFDGIRLVGGSRMARVPSGAAHSRAARRRCGARVRPRCPAAAAGSRR